MKIKHNLLSSAVRLGLTASAVSLLGLVSSPVIAQSEEQDAETTTMERMEVTGSRIKRADVEGAMPVTVIDREAIDASGDTSVADFLRNTTFNSFGSFRPQSGSSAQSLATVNLRGIGSGRTLILIDGRRAPNSPTTGQGQDLNSIPLAAVERIEILTDGASAIYGSDAIGGVINIITRKDFSGAEFNYGIGKPSRVGGDTEEGSFIMGMAGDRGSMMAGASYNKRDIIFQRDREWSRGGLSSYSNELYNAIANPGGNRFGWRTGSRVNNPTFGSVVPGFGCDEQGFTNNGTAGRCFYDFTFVAADEAAIDNQSLFTRGNYQINDDWSVYMDGSVSRTTSFGRYAPVPSSPWLDGQQPFIPVGSPNHPAVRFPNAGYNADVPYFLRHRFAALGNRDVSTEQNSYDLTLGFQGQLGEVSVDFGIRSSEQRFIELGRNYVVGGLAQDAISTGAYDIYDPFGNPTDVLESMVATVNRDATSAIDEIFANASMDLFEMGGGSAAVAFGVEYREETYFDIYDTLQSSGQIVGSAGNSAGGVRDVTAAYGELLLPVTDKFEVSVAGRFDDYSDYGSDFSPKVGLRFQPLETLTLRASWGQGFRAPTLDVLTAAPAFSADTVFDPTTCVALGLPATCGIQVNAYVLANPDLGSENSDQWSAGLVWDATDWLSITADYYKTDIEDLIAGITTGNIISCLLGAIPCPPGVTNLPADMTPPNPAFGLGLARSPEGDILFVQRGFSNRSLKTDGLDLNFRTKFDFGNWGGLDSQLQISNVFGYALDGARDLVDDPSTPEYRVSLQNVWTVGDFAFAWNISHVADTLSYQGLLINACNGNTDCEEASDYGYARRLPSWTTHDLQATWNSPWDGKLTLGVSNVLDKDPVTDPIDPTGRGFDFNLYDGYGRVPYFRYTQSF
jgi:iron complex outermembrane recepter protein